MNLSIRDTLNLDARQSAGNSQSIWAWLAEKLDLAQSRPQAAPGIIVSQIEGRDGVYYILKNPLTRTYFRLSDKDYFLWERMDGSHTVKELVVAYFMEYKVLAFGRVSGLLENLRNQYFLVEQPVNVYQQVRTQLDRRSPQARLARLWKAFIEKQFVIKGLDNGLTWIYKRAGWLYYTRPVRVLRLLVVIAGLACFFRVMLTGQYGVVSVNDSALLGVISLFIAYIVSIFFHEMGHAMTVKHYRREANRGGVMIYYGMPAFFVDTNDIWMEGKRARLAVTWAGPYTDLHQAGLASLVLFFLPDFTLNPVLFQFATVAYIGVLLNLNPLLELDGYFLLMDSLEIPMLRRKSLDFIRSGFWAKVGDLRAEGKKIREWLRAFSREERIFTVFGLLAAIWSVFSIFQALYFWQRRAAAAATSLFLQSSQAGRIAILVIGVILGLGLVVILGFTLLSLIRRLLAAAEKAGLFATPWRKAAWMWVLVLITGGAATINPSLAPSIGLLALVLATGFAVSNALDYSGSHFARVFWLMSVTCLAFWLAGLSGLAAGRVSQGSDILEMASAWVAGIAYLLLVSAALALFFGTSVRLLSLLEKIGLGLGLAASLGLMVSLAIQSQGAGNSPDAVILSALGGLPLAALLLLFPTLLAFWRTSTGPAALTIGLGLAGLSATALFDNPPVWAYLFLAAGFSLQQAAYRRRVTLHLDRDESDEVRSDHELLRQAFRWTAGGLNEQLYESAGTRQTDNLEMQFNKYAQAAGWPVQIDRDQVIDTSPSEWSLRQLGDTYTAALTLLLDLIAGHMGEKMTARALQRVYDAMPWEAREIASLYLFPELKRAQAIGQQFQAAQQTYRLLLQRAPIFAALSGEEIDHLASRLQVDKFSAGHTIIREGERGDRFYIITSGSVEVSRRNSRGISEIINHLGRGDYFGQIALLNDSPRTATCRATVPTEALSLSRAEFNKLVRVCFDLQGKIEKSIARMNLLRQIPLFSEMDSQQLQLISTHLSEERAEAGITIIRQGDDGQTFYVIESGRVQVSVSTESGEHVVNELGAGQFVGEMALLLQMPRAATVRALEPTNLLVLHKTDFDRLVVPQLYASRFLEQEMSRRMVGLRRASQAEI